MILFGVRIDDEAFKRAARGTPAAFFESIKQAMTRYLLYFRGKVSRERLRGVPGLARRTGFLAQSQKVVVIGTNMSSLNGEYSIGGGLVKYARIHEEGGIIRPVRAKFLAIPLQAAKTAAGVGRAVSPRDFKDTFVRKGIIWQRIEKGKRAPKGASSDLATRGKIIPLFVLKRQVKIEPRLGVVALFRGDEPKQTKYMGDAVRAALRRLKLA